jgi:Prokaryotic Cytochrome C oxidase subunit IV
MAWIALVAATLAIACLSEQRTRGLLIVPLVVLIAAFKVRLVFLCFMELAVTRPPWRYIFESWIAACALLIAGLYLYAPG